MLKRTLTLLLMFACGCLHADLTDAERQQLNWLNGYQHHTYEMDAKVKTREQHVELPRAINRIRCLELLRQGDRAAYMEFVQAQTADCLSWQNFGKLAEFIKKLNPEQYLLLRKAIILTAVSLTPQARAQIPAVKILNNSRLDFNAAWVRATPADRNLYLMFPPETNFRHMLYTEGGDQMFATLHKMIQLQYMRRAELDLWFAYWIINIAGFRGHIEQNGSVYLTNSVAIITLHLKSLIDNMLISPQYDVLAEYLEYRANLLGLQELPAPQRITLAHLGSLMRLYTPQTGQRLYQAFLRLPSTTQAALIKFFTQDIHTRPIITYAPALFANAFTLSHNNIELVVDRVLPVYLQVIKLQLESTSLNSLAKEANVRRILDGEQINLILNADLELDVG